MKITKVTPFLISSNYGMGKVLGQPLGVKTLGFVEIETSEGICGYGEAYCAIYAPESFVEIINIFAQELLDKYPEPEFLFDEIHIPFVTRSGFFKSVYSAIDIALWDIKSKYENQTIANLISSNLSKSSIKIYASGGSAAFSALEIQEDIKKQVSLGHNSYKMRIGFQTWEKDIERIIAAKNCLTEEKDLMVDAIMGTINPPWTYTVAKERLKQVENLNLKWIEEPLPPDNLIDYRSLKSEIAIPIASGEALTSKLDFESYILNGCVDYLQPDVTHCGGITAGKRICELAMQNKIKISMHVWGSPLALAANKELAMAYGNVEWLEVPTVELEFAKDFDTNVEISHGKVFAELQKGFSFPNKNELLKKYPFVSGSGFKFPNRK
ncbi:mandelate racemase/muconate lactonizing enzyme family protein [Leptospira noguchii]|uniref:Mandelate racemase/muconate lactonizing enzyme family protein n=1 Tax=Leptospira noguchii TaxID=28182 RepID=A0AAE9G8H7_9LEPT|nr:mandelate racemase/muconate lactonizing enzyme family protein [Leptospira noguchii]UOG29271.1 mandelate racemase/muconate lactonizing enzyme family protein [Leptospira noguchii]UOG35383.1 mandelate racemase/muconate lactonizing enzyme family protein [Leptospira noguchii]UOG46301.1 mandelate racemase/muconate lactonizing enzyme family protein [Leptospira noguchii]UOG55416.1 mandelate racemase/muconate lactonizing enzyme family protein [Leptospira noguchii]